MSPSLFYSVSQQPGLSSTALEDLDPNDPILASFFSSLPPFKRLVPSRPTPQCSLASTAMRIQNLDTTTKPGPFTNILARQDTEASLHLLDLVVQAFQEGEICSWLDASSLLGAYHHAAPLPYTSFIEVGILLSDLKKTLSVRVAETANFFALNLFSISGLAIVLKREPDWLCFTRRRPRRFAPGNRNTFFSRP